MLYPLNNAGVEFTFVKGGRDSGHNEIVLLGSSSARRRRSEPAYPVFTLFGTTFKQREYNRGFSAGGGKWHPY